MCGISGVFNFGQNKSQLKSAVEIMIDVQKRRGPDDGGLFLDDKNGIALGHNRLSIIDLSSAGHQPMQYRCQVSGVRCQVSITFNGEIYNFLELKKELAARGHEFKTKTDTEVVLAAYAEWGADSFAKLRGMFAFALWDEERKKLYLVKDRYGIKPLYYYCDKENLVFASTVKAIKQSGLAPSSKNEQALIGFLLFGSVPLPHTTEKDIYGLLAGHYLEIDTAYNKKIVKYYEPLDYFARAQEHESIKTTEKTRELLEESVRLHMISDAPLGVFLSGGVDSSILAILASANTGFQTPGVRRTPGVSGRLKTLSIIFDEHEYSEQKYQRIVADKIQSDHHEYKVTRRDFESALPDIFEAMDQPTVDGINTYFVSEAAKKAGLKTVLSGLGADEIFFGYNHFRRAAILRKIQQLPNFLKWSLKIGGIFGDRYAKLQYLEGQTLQKEGLTLLGDPLRFYLAIRGLFVPAEVAKILDISIKEVNNFIDSFSTSCYLQNTSLQHMHPANLLSYLELKFYLQNQLLKDSDFMAMHHSIEIRVPFLDHLLVEYVSSLPAETKLNIGKSDLPDIDSSPGRSDFQKLSKPLLIAAVKDVLPEAIWNRSKMGFTFPLQKWLGVSGHWSRYWAREVVKKF